jgi:hypothetical protein
MSKYTSKELVEMEKELKTVLKRNNIVYLKKIKEENILKNVRDLFIDDEIKYYIYNEYYYYYLIKYYLCKKNSLMLIWYDHIVNNKELMKDCFKDCKNLALYFKNINDDKKMIYCYETASYYGCTHSMMLLGEYYKKKKIMNKMKYWYEKEIEKNKKKNKSLVILRDYFILIEDYQNLVSLVFKYKEYFYNYLNFHYVRNLQSKIDECPICYESTNLILYDCTGHYQCTSCYLKMKICPYCKIPKNNCFLNKNLFKIT